VLAGRTVFFTLPLVAACEGQAWGDGHTVAIFGAGVDAATPAIG
jgi:hypothetical protein